MTTNNLVTLIASSFMTTNLDTKSINSENSKIDSHSYEATKNEDGTYDAIIGVEMTGDDFEYESGDLKVTKAEVSFEVDLMGCTYDDKKGWEWNPDTGSYAINSGIHEPNILTFSADDVVNDCDSDDVYSGGLSKDEDIALSKTIVNKIIDWTPQASLLKVFKEMVKQVEAPIQQAQ